MNVKMMIQSLVDELKEVESLEELEALNKANEEEHGPNGPELKEAYEEAMKRFTKSTPTVEDLMKKLAEYEELLKSLVGKPTAVLPQAKTTPVARVPRISKKYKLLKLDVSWTNKPQVHAVMRILEAHMSVGDVVDETQIVEMMIANENVLATRQGGKRIWDYYKGAHADGLIAHGNIEVVA